MALARPPRCSCCCRKKTAIRSIAVFLLIRSADGKGSQPACRKICLLRLAQPSDRTSGSFR
eukprot:scaffold36286_cov64-Phaeocystis_antarctica.AAC.1